jgi:hypothetical protein
MCTSYIRNGVKGRGSLTRKPASPHPVVMHLGEKDEAHKADNMRLVEDLNGKNTTGN